MARLTVRLPDEMNERLKDYACSRKLTVNHVLVRLIEKLLENPEALDSLSEKYTLDIDTFCGRVDYLHSGQEKIRKQIEDLSGKLDLFIKFRDDIKEVEDRKDLPVKEEKKVPEKKVSEEKNQEEKVSEKKKEVIESLSLSEIVISDKFIETPPRKEKVQETIAYYKKHGEFDKLVVVRKRDMLLIDGYKRYVAARELGLEKIQVKLK